MGFVGRQRDSIFPVLYRCIRRIPLEISGIKMAHLLLRNLLQSMSDAVDH